MKTAVAANSDSDLVEVMPLTNSTDMMVCYASCLVNVSAKDIPPELEPRQHRKGAERDLHWMKELQHESPLHVIKSCNRDQ